MLLNLSIPEKKYSAGARFFTLFIFLAGGSSSASLLASEHSLAPLEEVLVVARKREERLQDVPISVSAFSAQEIANSGMQNMADVAYMTPGLTISPLFGVDFWTPVIRGLATTIGEPNVGFFIDGVYQGSRTSMPQLLGNFIDHIEVAKGPQSALFGRNTFGGAINYVTRKPSDTLEGGIEVTLGDHGKKHIQGGIGGPLGASDWYFRVSALWDEFDGYFRNDLTGDDLDSSDTDGVLLTLGGLPWESVEVALNAGYQNINSGDLPLQFVENNAEFVSALNAFQVYRGEVPAGKDFAVTPGGLDSDFYTTSLRVDWDLGQHTLTSLTGYNDLKHDRYRDDDYSAPEYHFASQLQRQNEWSQELRLTSATGERLRWMAGLYFYAFDDDQTVASSYVGDFAYLGGSRIDTTQKNDEAAIFGSLGISLTETVEVTLEARYSKEKKKIDSVDTYLNLSTTLRFKQSDSWDMFLPKITVDWRINDQNMVYASYARSEKSGGYNAITTAGIILPDERTYEPEKSDNYEIGLKSQSDDNRYMATLAVFLINWDDQIVRTLGDSLAVLNTNVGSSTSQGLEFELLGQPTERISVRLGVAYTDAKFDDYNFDVLETFLGLDPVMDGNPLPLVSEWTANASAEYTHPIWNGNWDFFSRFDWDYRSEQSIVETNDATVGSSDRLNIRMGLRNFNWTLTVWGRNVLGDDTAAAGLFIPNPAIEPENITGQREGVPLFQALVTTPEPESWGVTVDYSF